jgi:3-methyladenine DNA glycosylase AlkD
MYTGAYLLSCINKPEIDMKLSLKAENILDQINEKTMLGALRKIAKDTKKDHELAMELWSTEKFLPRQLAILIMDNKLLS